MFARELPPEAPLSKAHTGLRVLWTTTESDNGMVILSPLENHMVNSGVEVGMMRLGEIRGPWQLRRLRQAVRLRSEQYDLVHAQYGSACAVASIPESGKPFAVTLRGSDWNPYTGPHTSLMIKTRLARCMSRSAIRRADLVVCSSDRMRCDAERVADPSRITVLPTPIDLARLSRIDADRPSLRSAIAPEYSPNARWLLFTALSLSSPIKRFGLAQKAVDMARRSSPEPIELVTATGLPWEAVARLTSLSDLILSTSTAEGWPNCIKEGLACDVPFVATDTGDLRSIADREPSCAVVNADPESLSGAILRSLAVTRLNRPALRHHVEWMALATIGDRLQAAYRRAILGDTATGTST